MESEETAADNTVTGTVMLGAGVPVSGVDNSLSQPAYMLPHNQVMTDQQMETLRRQISVYSTICSQLVEMHKAMSQQGSVSRQHMLYDTVAAAPGIKPSARQRWTPSQAQLHILETLYEAGNGTPSRQRIKEITSELSKHGQISETSVYNWFQNRKARAKRKQQQLPLKEGESEGDTDGESSKEKKSKLDGEFHQEDTAAGQGEQNAQASEKTHGAITHKPRSIDEQQFDDTQETALSSLLLPEAEAEPHVLIDRTGTAAVASTEYGVTQTKFAASTQLGSGTMTVMLDGKQWQVPIGVVDVRRMFGDNAVLLDSRGHMVPTNDAGVTFHPLHASESYTLLRHGEIRGSTSAKSSEGLLVHNLHHISGILNEGLVGGPMLH